jgi:hypothetical protein
MEKNPSPLRRGWGKRISVIWKCGENLDTTVVSFFF